MLHIAAEVAGAVSVIGKSSEIRVFHNRHQWACLASDLEAGGVLLECAQRSGS